ncbi:MAG: helix-turn-helix transcriptional regulator [Lachnospiraceae bacterium]|nr:helix-turn-helix transcriptional regulator [Lachnospiraceae bacterium]
MDLQMVGQKIKRAREARNLSQEDLAALVDLSPTHISVIERGLKATRLDTFIAIANALEVSADSLLVDVVEHSLLGVTNELYSMISKLSKKEQKRIINVVKALIEDS